MTKAIKIIEEALKNKHNFNSFCISIQSKDKSIDRNIRDRIRQKINPEVKEENNNLCILCGKNVLTKTNTVHHIIPERYSGSYDKKNLLVVCMKCHIIIENCIRIVEREAIKHTLIYLRNQQTANEKIQNK